MTTSALPSSLTGEKIAEWSPRYAAEGMGDHVEKCAERFAAMLEEAIADDLSAYGEEARS